MRLRKEGRAFFVFLERLGESEVITTLIVFLEMMVSKFFSKLVQTVGALWSVQSDVLRTE